MAAGDPALHRAFLPLHRRPDRRDRDLVRDPVHRPLPPGDVRLRGGGHPLAQPRGRLRTHPGHRPVPAVPAGALSTGRLSGCRLGAAPGSLFRVGEDQAPGGDQHGHESSQRDVPEQIKVRLAKRERLLAEGADPYPVGFPRTDTIAEIRDRYPNLAPDTATGDRVGVVGRVMLSRVGGKLSFATIRDGTGDIQVMISQDRVGPDALAAWKHDVDLGDHVGVEGEVISSRRGELSVLADRFAITAKALRPLPEKHHGLTDPESRVRQRYVDLIVNPKARRMAEIRAAATRAVREELHDRGFLEVETPILQRIHGGANARPFATHINAYDMDLYLRIALELYLKRLIVGGIEKVYEIGRNFRNEGVDATHNPEFTMLEAYEAYGDYTTVATLTRELIQISSRVSAA